MASLWRFLVKFASLIVWKLDRNACHSSAKLRSWIVPFPSASYPETSVAPSRYPTISASAAASWSMSASVLNGPGLTRTAPSGNVPSARWM